MIIDILNSDIDSAGRNIRQAIDKLVEANGKNAYPIFNGNEVIFHTINERIINAPASAVNPYADLVIVVSRHSSINPVPVLTVHPAGNYGIAQLGGNDRELGRSSPTWMKSVLQNQAKFAPEGYRVSYEITHHGPTDFPIPFFFVEVGSTEKEWNDEKAYTAVAKSVLYANPSSNSIPLIGFGGTHYAVRQSVIGIETKGAMGHMMHTRDVGNVTAAIVSQMVEKSGPAVAAYMDRKALSKQEINHIESILRELGIEELSEGDLQKINQMSYKTWKKYKKIADNTGFNLKL
ncbi:MAG TPA: D-tyrosyl-tRNA(Tyr) deacylase, partial [Methanocorpusculum sp.]|nr:D-tyrosyl-tRNA(Tyr) deacylase [Methanocorpusculum sp.]